MNRKWLAAALLSGALPFPAFAQDVPPADEAMAEAASGAVPTEAPEERGQIESVETANPAEDGAAAAKPANAKKAAPKAEKAKAPSTGDAAPAKGGAKKSSKAK